MSDGSDALLRLLQAEDIDGAISWLTAALPSAAAAERFALLFTRGRLRTAQGDARLALADLDAALTLAPSDAARSQVLVARAEARVLAQQPGPARMDLEAALRMLLDTADRADAIRLLARLDLEEGRAGDAIGRLSQLRTELQGNQHLAEVRAEVALDLAGILRSAGAAHEARQVLEDTALWAVDQPDWAYRVGVQLATTLAFEGRYDLAVAQYTAALALQPEPSERARTLYNRAVAYRELGNGAAALADLRNALDHDDTLDAAARFDLRLVLGIVQRESGSPHAALEALRQAIDIAPEPDAEGRARLEVGITLATTGVHGLAAQEFGAAIALCNDPLDRARAHRYRATTRRELGLPALALEDVTHALELTSDPDERARGAVTQAALLLELHRDHEAYRALVEAPQEGIEDDEIRAQLHFQLGTLATQRGDIERAISALTSAIDVAQHRNDNMLLGQALLNLGVAQDIAGDADGARAAFHKVVRISPSAELVYQAWMNVGRVEADAGDPQAALAAFGMAAAAADDRDARAMAFLSRGSAAMRTGRYIDADADFTRILVLQPSDPIATQARYYRGLTAGLLGQLERARNDLTITIERERDRDNRAQALLERGLIAQSAGDFTSAERDLREAAQSFRRRSQRAIAHVHLAALAAQRADCAGVLLELARARRLDTSEASLDVARKDPRFQRCWNGNTEELPVTEPDPED